MLQLYRMTISDATGFTQYRLTFGRDMRLPVDFGTPFPESPREVRTHAAELAEDLEWSYKVAREVIEHIHKRADEQYNERVVKRVYKPGTLVRVILYARSRKVLSKLDAQYFGLSKVLEVRGAQLTVRELDTKRVFTANYDLINRSTIERFAAQPQPVARASPLSPAPHAASLRPDNVIAAQQLAPYVDFIPF